MTCNGCGNTKAYKTVTGTGYEYCNSCGDFPTASVPDIYWDGKPEEGLADDPATGKPRVFGSRAEKAAYLKERGLVEAGDRMRGAPPSALNEPSVSHGRTAMEVLREIRSMSNERRREEVRKILYEARQGR